MAAYPGLITPIGHREPVPRRIRGMLGDRVVLDTTRAVYVWEWPPYPQYYVPAADGAESLDPADIGTAVAAVRSSCPGTPVGVSTGLWITGGDVARRHATVARWADLGADQRPAFASVNVGEDGFAELVALLRRAGVDVEAGVWSPPDAERLDGVPVDRILIEILDTPAADAVAVADEILGRLDRRGVTGPRLLHGEQDACWPLIAHAGRLGLPTRIGLEDTLVTDDGRPATGNADLVSRALRVWTAQRDRR
jgi:uncharacterized protein (DUF849 family)